jgi:hypothetical protein
MDWLTMGNLVKENRNRPAEPYTPKPINTFSDAVQVQKEVSPDYSALLTRARYLAHRYGYVNADLLRENSQDIVTGSKIIFGTILNSRNFEEGGRVTSNVKGSHGRKISNWYLKINA